MVRKKAAAVNQKNTNGIKWRSHEPSRLETFSDAVFAFALTLIIVSVEVPKSFDELLETMKGSLSFAICFTLLFQIWNSQNMFFRKYGLKDNYTTVLNGCLLFVVLIYVYPLKFLSVLLFSNNIYTVSGVRHQMIGANQNWLLMVIYGLGYTVINFIFYLMHHNAVRHAVEIELTEKELYETKTSAYMMLICSAIGVLAIATAIILPQPIAGLSGYLYFLIPLAYFMWFSYRGRKSRLKYP